MLDRIVVDVVKARPIPLFIPNTRVPIIMPHLAAPRVVPLVDLKRGCAVQLAKKTGQIMAAIGLEQQMVMVVEDDPGAKRYVKFMDEFL